MQPPPPAIAAPGVIVPTAAHNVTAINLPAEPCFVCEFTHPPEWHCPEMGQEVCLRLALDRLRRMAHLEPAVAAARREFLVERLMRLSFTAPGMGQGA